VRVLRCSRAGSWVAHRDPTDLGIKARIKVLFDISLGLDVTLWTSAFVNALAAAKEAIMNITGTAYAVCALVGFTFLRVLGGHDPTRVKDE
jgi:hypothetical protein